MTQETLLHSSTVYLYRYEAEGGAYAQLGESALGCALLRGGGNTGSSPDGFKLLLYNAQKHPVLQLPVALGTRFSAQGEAHASFYDAEQQNYSLRFRDARERDAFLSAAAFVRAHVAAHAPKLLKASRGDRLFVGVDELAPGRADAAPLGLGDVAGVALRRWQGAAADRDAFFPPNPLDIAQLPPAEETAPGDVRRIKLVEYGASAEQDLLTRALAAEALVGMQKGAKRLVTVVAASTQEWFIAQIELVKVKKANRASAAAGDAGETKETDEEVKEVEQNGEHADLVKRMASLSRAGSQSTGLIASLNSRIASRHDSLDQPVVAEDLATLAVEGHSSSFARQSSSPPAGYVPVLLAGLQLPGERADSLSRINTSTESAGLERGNSVSPASSLAAKVIAPLKQQSLKIPSSDSPSEDPVSSMLSSEMEMLMKEQSDLEKLRRELEESKKKLQSEDFSSPVSSTPAPTATTTPALSLTSTASSTSSSYKPWEKPVFVPTSFEPASSILNLPSSLSAPTTTGNASASSRWTPSSSFELVPSFSPTSFAPPSSLPPPPAPFSSALSPYGTRSIGVTSGLSGEVENGISRLQRSSTSIESRLEDLQSKMDRLLNMQSSFKTSKYSSGGLFSNSTTGLSSSSSSVGGAGINSTSSLLKSLEKALAQRDQLQEVNARLQDSVTHLESTVEEFQGQHESLQMENRNLLDKLQNSNQLQQDKFRLELRNLQQQLSHTQEQMLMYQEENFHLRSEMASKEEQLAKEKIRLQEDARKQLEQLQRQLQGQIQQDSQDALGKMMAEKKALESQLSDAASQKAAWEVERESLKTQLRQAQTQQLQFQNEKAQSQAAQVSRVQELEAQLQLVQGEYKTAKLQADRYAAESQHLEELLTAKEHELGEMQTMKNEQEYAALSELLKEFMNDIYFHFQDAFDEEAEFTGKEIVMAIRKILKQNTMDILSRLEEFWHLQGHDGGH